MKDEYLWDKLLFISSLLILLIPLTVTAQKESNTWYFGLNAGIDFNTSPPDVLTDGQTNSREGVATISDKYTGKLLFYTEGTTVWDADQQVMPNGAGLKGDYSSTQSAIIVPNPADSNKYYIFTTAGGKGFRYSEVDMTLHGGKGDIITGTKNSLLIPENESTEKLIATRHCNGKDYWVITHTLKDNRYYVYPITAAGIQPPLIFSIGAVIHANGGETTSYLKISPDGNLLANAFGNPLGQSTSKVELFHFNNKTGAISNPLPTLDNLQYPYGVEFSPNGTLLYVSTQHGAFIYQYDLNKPDINSSRTLINSSSILNYGALQLGPDGKIYVSAEMGSSVGYPYLGVINNPDVVGIGCNFVPNAIYLEGKKTLIGLPTFIGSFFYHPLDFQISNTCLGSKTKFNIVNSKNIDSAKWDFGDHAFSTDFNPAHQYMEAKSYTVSLVIYRACSTDTAYKTITIHEGYNRIDTVTICEGTTYHLPDGKEVSKSGTYISLLKTIYNCDSLITTHLIVNPSFHKTVYDSICRGEDYTLPDNSVVNKPGSYISTFQTHTGCDSVITTILSYWNTMPLQYTDSISEVNLCLGSETKFNIFNLKNIDSTKWDFGDHTFSTDINPAHQYMESKKYNIRLIIYRTCTTDTAHKTITIHEGYSRIDTVTVCEGTTYHLPDGQEVDKSGTYISSFKTIYGCDSLITTELIVNPSYHKTVNDSICHGQDYTLPDDSIVNEPGNYTSVLHTQTGCDSVINTILSYRNNILLQYTDSICEGTTLQLPNGQEINQEGIYKITLPSVTGCDTVATYYIYMKHPPVIDLGPDTCLLAGQQLLLDPGPNYSHYEWQNGSTLPTFSVSFPGTYNVKVSNECGYSTDTIKVTMDCVGQIFIPSAFTPNGDGMNDIFRILNVHGQKLLHFSVLDRWGKRVFYTTNISEGWDGTFNGKQLSMGSYVYLIKLLDTTGEVKVYKGTVLLLH